MGFQDVAFLSSQACFTPHFLKIVVEVKASGQPCVLKLWLGVSSNILPDKYFCCNKDSFLCQLNIMEIIRLSQRYGDSGHPQFGVITRSKTAVSVYTVHFIPHNFHSNQTLPVSVKIPTHQHRTSIQ